MLRRLRVRFGVPGIIAVAALIFAMAGGAWAAQKYVITSKSQIKPSVLKQLKGEAGPGGPQGQPGANGAKGDTGSPGAPGTSVTTSAASEAECGKAGGVKVTSASGNTKVCNGTTGFTKTLPSGETETGTWIVGPVAAEVTTVRVPISFSIPLATNVDVHVLPLPGTATQLEIEAAEAACPGSHEEPVATAGNLCLYGFNGFGVVLVNEQDPETGEIEEGAGKVGVLMRFEVTAPGGVTRGDWAVTAP